MKKYKLHNLQIKLIETARRASLDEILTIDCLRKNYESTGYCNPNCGGNCGGSCCPCSSCGGNCGNLQELYQ